MVPRQRGDKTAAIVNRRIEQSKYQTMKANRLFWRMNLTVAALLLVLACVSFLTGCGSTGDRDGSAPERSDSQGSCH